LFTKYSWHNLSSLKQRNRQQKIEIQTNREVINLLKDRFLEEKKNKESAVQDLFSLVKSFKSIISNVNIPNIDGEIARIVALEERYTNLS